MGVTVDDKNEKIERKENEFSFLSKKIGTSRKIHMVNGKKADLTVTIKKIKY